MMLWLGGKANDDIVGGDVPVRDVPSGARETA